MNRGKKRGPPALLAAVALSLLLVQTVQPSRQAEPPARAAGRALVQVNGMAGRKLVPLGRAVGIKLFSSGVLVVGLSELESDRGSVSPGKSCGLHMGDVITHINGREVDTIEEVQDILKREGDRPLTLQASRSRKTVQLSARPVKNSQGVYQLGVWLRDSMAGIGTMTFYDPANGTFAALGHGINDVDTSVLMPMESGSIMYAEISDVRRGRAGDPGELHGTFEVDRDLGTLRANTGQGIFGTLTDRAMLNGAVPMEIASADEVTPGPAVILSNICGDEVREYAVELTRVSPEGSRNLTIRVTDPELLEKTGGIVQGMSGSPIIQDGRLVGAVTHVLVNDPTRGYGIFIENMLEAME